MRSTARPAVRARRARPAPTSRCMRQRRATYVVAALLIGWALGCDGDTSAESRWRTTADRRAGPGELPYPPDTKVDSLASRVFSESDTIGIPTNVRLAHGRLVVVDYGADPLLVLLDTADAGVTGAFGRVGQGPGEFLTRSPRLTSADGDTAREGNVWLVDADRRVIRADLDERRTVDSVTLALEERVGDIVWVNDSQMLATTYDTLSMLALVDAEGRLIRRITGDTAGWGTMPPADAVDGRQSRMCSDGKDRVAIAYRWAPTVTIYDKHGGNIARARTPHAFAPWVAAHPITRSRRFNTAGPNVRAAYWDCTANSRYIFALYSGRLHKSFPRKLHECWYVHVFDWSGNLVRVLRLDHGAGSVAVNADGTLLYSVDYTSAQMPIRVSSLSGLPP